MNKWEYRIFETKTDDLDLLEIKLNQIGDENWELISTIDDGDILIFKRPCFNILPMTAKSRIEKDMNGV